MRKAGILLPIFSLPSKHGIGCFSKEAYDFVDFLYETKQTLWQILPLVPTTIGDSPYQGVSSFAGNPYFIDLEELKNEGLITKEDIEYMNFGESDSEIDYGRIYGARYPLLRKAFQKSFNDKINGHELSESYKKFIYEEGDWVEKYALFMSIKDKFNGLPYYEWEDEYKYYDEDNIQKLYNNKTDFENICFYRFIQFKFNEQWLKLKKYANDKNIKIIGDIPIYVARDSVECWSEKENFLFDKTLTPKFVAGCPPDSFSSEGQLWGNPIYDWEYIKNNNYDFWIRRFKRSFKIYDIVRLDHFRGFDEYYKILSSDSDAKRGTWEKGPGISLFKKVEEALGKKEFIAEDLGLINDSTRKLVNDTNFPGMKVMQFAFSDTYNKSSNAYLPHNLIINSVSYTGTHDNETLCEWLDKLNKEDKKYLRDYLFDYDTKDNLLYKKIIAMVMRSVSKYAIIPMQDYIGLGKNARINSPSTFGTNWRFRLSKGQLTNDIKDFIKNLTINYGR